MMTLPMINTKDLLKTLHPKQFGRYDVRLDRDYELVLFHWCAEAMDFPVWAVDVKQAQIDLNMGSASALGGLENEVMVYLTFQVNNEDTTYTAKLLLPSASIEALSPVMP